MRTVNFILPKDWNDLTTDQLLFVSKLFTKKLKSPYEFLALAFVQFAQLRLRVGTRGGYAVKKKGEKKFRISSKQVHSAARSLGFLLNTVKETTQVKGILFAKPCHPRLYNTKFKQYLTAENFYSAFQETNKPLYLDCLVATLYHWKGQKFDENKIKRRALKFRFAPYHLRYGVFLWYSGFRWYVTKECPNIFSGGGGEVKKIKDHIYGIIRILTEGDITKNKAVEESDTWEALMELDAKAKSAKELKAKMDEIKNKKK